MIGLPDRVSGLTCLVRRQRQKEKVPVIVVNQKVTLERRRFTLAHELAHRLIDESSPVHLEKVIGCFCGRLSRAAVSSRQRDWQGPKGHWLPGTDPAQADVPGERGNAARALQAGRRDQ